MKQFKSIEEYNKYCAEMRKLWESGSVLIQLENKCTIWTTGECIFADCDGNLVAIMKNNYTWKWTGENCPEYAKKTLITFLNKIRKHIAA